MVRLRPWCPSSWSLAGAFKATGQKRDKQRDDCVRGPEWNLHMEEVKCTTIISGAVFSPKRTKNAVSRILFAPINFSDRQARKAKVGMGSL